MRTEQTRIWRKSYDAKRTIKAHEYVVVFKKPEERRKEAGSETDTRAA